MNDIKLKNLENAFDAIEKNFGKGSIMKLGDKAQINVDTTSTGILPLDIALGVGGLPKGRIIEIYGPESSGKTTITLHAIAEVQKQGGTAAFIDAEHALDPVYAKALGVDTDNLIISQPDYGEQGLAIAEQLIASGAIDILVIDSVAALVPKKELEGEIGDSHMGLHARLMSQALRKLTGLICRTNCIVIFINQIREKIGIQFGSNETTTGGRSLKFYASVRLDVRKIDTIKQGDNFLGNLVRVKVVKNKVAPPLTQSTFEIAYGTGVSKEASLLDIGVDKGIINKAGAWYSYNGNKIGQGKEKSKEFLIENQEIALEIEKKILEVAFM